jgi:hypothetical protein
MTMKNQLTLLHFENPEELIAGIDTLQKHHLIIHEVYSSKNIPGIEARLSTRQWRLGAAIIRFGCFGGLVLTPLFFYVQQSGLNWKAVTLDIILLVVALFFAGCLTPIKAPKFRKLQTGDQRYLAIVDTENIPVSESITHLFQYARAVEFSPGIKKIVIS